MKDMMYYIYAYDEETRAEVPLVMTDDKVVCFSTKDRAERFFNEMLKRTNEFDEEVIALFKKAYIKNCIVFSDDGFIVDDEVELAVFGEILPKEPKMTEIIEDLLYHYYFDNAKEVYTSTGCDYYEDVCVDEAIDALFAENGFDDKDYNCELIEAFDSPGVTIYILSIAWIEYEKLFTYNTTVYSL